MEFKLYLLDSCDHSFAHDELKCYVVFQLNSVLESLLSKVARYDQGSILAPMFSLMVCIGLRGRRQKERERRRGGEGEGERKRKRERGMRFFPPPLPRSLPLLCPHVFIRVYIRLRGRRQKERDRRWGEEGEGNVNFS